MGALSRWLCQITVFAVASSGLTLFPATVSAQIEEIIITARKREENLQEVPISVSVISSEDIAKLGINNIRDVSKYTPGVEFDEGFGAQDTRIVIRGLSATRGRPNAAFLVDGVDFTGEAVQTAGGGLSINQRLIDVERVEVVKGTQAALYGRSAFAGAIQYITKNPGDELESEIGVDINDEEQYQVTGSIGGPVTDTLGLRLNGLWYDDEGFYEGALTNDEVGGADGWGLALTGVWDPTERLSVKARIAYSEDDYTPAAQARVQGDTYVDLREDEYFLEDDAGNLVLDDMGNPVLGSGLVFTSGLGAFIGGNYPQCDTAVSPPEVVEQALSSCLAQPKYLATGKMPDGDDLAVRNSPNPNNPGSEYEGTEIDTLTFTLTVNWDTELGTFSSITGYSDLDATQNFDSEWDAMSPTQQFFPGEWDDIVNSPGQFTAPDGTWTDTIDADCSGFIDCGPVNQWQDLENETSLFSQEIRWASAFDGPVQLTAGALYWNEEVEQNSLSVSISPPLFRGFPFATPPIDQPSAAEVESAAVDVRDPADVAAWMAANPGAPVPADLFVDPRNQDREVEHWSVYGLVEWEISDAWKLSIEARYVDEETEVVAPVCDTQATFELTGLGSADQCDVNSFRGPSSIAITNAGGSLPVGTHATPITNDLAAKSDGDFVTPKVTIEWAPNDEQLWYLSWAEGKKPGGISTVTAGSFFKPDELRFDEETLDAWELGNKSTFLDGNLVLNSAVFFQQYDDKQVGITNFDRELMVDVGRIENAGEAEIWGIELEASWRATENLLFSGGYTWLDAEYTKFEATTASSNAVARLLRSGQGGCLSLVPTEPGVTGNCRVSYTGLDIEDIPENSFVGQANYTAPLAATGLEWFGEVSAIFTDERWMDEANVKQLDSFWLFDLRLGVVAENWDVVLYVENVFDDDTVKTGIDVGSLTETFRIAQFPPAPTDGVIVTLPDPRVFGLRAAYRF